MSWVTDSVLGRGAGVTQIWRSRAGLLLMAFVLLDAAIVIYTRTVGASPNSHQPLGGQLLWVALDTWLAWRVWHGGRIAWGVLVALSALTLLTILLGAVWPWGPYLTGLMLLLAVQTLLLFSPPVRRHVRRLASAPQP
jgi:hypothetical protein